MKKIPIVDYEGYLNIDGNCCPKCGGTRITIHEQRNLQVDRNLSSGKAIKLCDGKVKPMSKMEKASAFDSADTSGGGGCWSYECRKCGWKSEMYTE